MNFETLFLTYTHYRNDPLTYTFITSQVATLVERLTSVQKDPSTNPSRGNLFLIED